MWSPDGKQIAFLCDATAEDIAKKQKKDAPAEPEHESDVKVITRAIYRFNGTGYLDPKHKQHIWILDLPASADAKSSPRQLTSGVFDEHGPVFTLDGKHILYTTNRNPEPYYELTKDGHHVGANFRRNARDADHSSRWGISGRCRRDNPFARWEVRGVCGKRSGAGAVLHAI